MAISAALLPSFAYKRHEPSKTLLYQIIENHYPEFADLMEAQGRRLPDFVQRTFSDYLKCGLLENGFIRVRCDQCHDERLVAFSCKRRGICPSCGTRQMAETAKLLVDDVIPHQPVRQWVLTFPYQLRFLFACYPEILTAVLAIVLRAVSTHLVHKAGYSNRQAQTGTVTLIQRFGSALNLNIHMHMLFLDGVYRKTTHGLYFHRVKVPTQRELQSLVHTLSHRIGRFLERKGLLVRDIENSYLQLDGLESSPMDDVLGHSITYRVAVGPQAGTKVFSLQTVPAQELSRKPYVATESGFNLHAGVIAQAHQRDKLERLCRYICRPPIAEERLSLTSSGLVRYALKTPFRDGTTHVVFQPLDFISKLAALIPRPRMNLTCYSGVFAPNHRWRSQVTPAGRGSGRATNDTAKDEPASHRRNMTWAQRLKRVFAIDIERCDSCGGPVRLIACIEEPEVIDKILNHLCQTGKLEPSIRQDNRLPPLRAPPDVVY